MKWSNNNRACKTVWTTLIALDQFSETQVFKTAGDKKIKTLTFFPKDATGDVVNVRANSLARQLDKIFRLVRGASYEKTITQNKAVAAISEILKDGDKTVADLADACDDAYLFFGEEDQ